jgi:hypothetical protein
MSYIFRNQTDGTCVLYLQGVNELPLGDIRLLTASIDIERVANYAAKTTFRQVAQTNFAGILP